MRLSSRLRTFGYFGSVVPPEFAFNCTARAAWESAIKSGVMRLPVEDDSDRNPICLTYTLTFPAAINVVNQYRVLQGDIANLRALSEVVGTGQPGVSHQDATQNTPAAYRTTSHIVPANTAHAIRARLAKKPKSQTLHLDQFRWDGWVFEILKGRPQLLKTSADWSEAQENALHELLAMDERSASQEQAVEEIKKTIYEVYEGLDLNTKSDDWYGTEWAVTFIPEGRGVVHVFLEGAGHTTVKVERLLEQRAAVWLWQDSPLIYRTYGGASFWQLGYPQFAAAGEILFRNRLTADYTEYVSEAEYTINGLLPDGTTSQTYPPEEGGYNFDIRLGLGASPDLRRTPFLYSFTAKRQAGERTGTTDVSFDTDDVAGGNPVTEASVSFDGPNNRRRVVVGMRNINGATLNGVGDEDYGHDGLENRLATFSVGGTAVITNGLVESSRQINLRGASYALSRTQIARPDSAVEVPISDLWQRLDEVPCRPALIGDGLYLGAQIRRVLTMCGIKEAEMAGVSANTGPLIDPAAYGEEWREVASEDASCGDYIRHLMEVYGYKLHLWITGAGVFTLEEPSTTITHTFVRAHTGNPDQLAHRKIMLDGLEFVREYSGFYNHFVVEGGKGADGKPIRAEHLIQESVLRPDSPSYIGRRKSYPVYRDDGIRTKSHAAYALRSLVWQHGRKGRYVQFPTFHQANLFPWQRISADGTICEISAVNGTSLQNDRLMIIGREI